jgi:hypothetical protein
MTITPRVRWWALMLSVELGGNSVSPLALMLRVEFRAAVEARGNPVLNFPKGAINAPPN